MPTSPSSSDAITKELHGLQCLQVVLNGQTHMTMFFEHGTMLFVEATAEGLVATVQSPRNSPSDLPQPTRRQHEYLVFIGKYVARYGLPPAESEIERHFMVSAPSVNNMMQTLEKRGFITRQKGVGRSTKFRPDLEPVYVVAKSGR